MVRNLRVTKLPLVALIKICRMELRYSNRQYNDTKPVLTALRIIAKETRVYKIYEQLFRLDFLICCTNIINKRDGACIMHGKNEKCVKKFCLKNFKSRGPLNAPKFRCENNFEFKIQWPNIRPDLFRPV
jgi:hypothetical protein